MATTTTTTATTTTPSKLTKLSAHTAGIYADMTIDGEEIGTLVVVVDRARHLPNRKTVGKQNPYCAARLGKDAKKTATDKRGGQTPRWDQELRFTVYDSADYHKLKISLFNDDKKCDLIGEAWIQLTDILRSGGGQSDKWHPLNWKGKYAGDIQLELTFWDSRPPPPKEQAKDTKEFRTTQRAESAPEPLLNGPRGLKKRPLPAQPGAPASQVVAAPVRAQSEQPQQSSTKGRSFGPRELNPEPVQLPPQPERHSVGGHEAQLDFGYGYEQRQQAGSQLAFEQPNLPESASDAYHSQEQEPEPVYPVQQHHDAYIAPQQPSHDHSDIYDDDPYSQPQSSGLELPELPPLAPRTQRQAAAQPPRHYVAADRQTTSDYALPHYNQPAPMRSIEPLRPSSRQSAVPSHYSSCGPRRSFGEAAAPDSMLDSPPPPPPPTHRNRGYTEAPQPLALSYGEPNYHEFASIRPQLTAEALHDPSLDDELYLPMPGAETQLSTRSAPLPEGYHDPHPPRRNSGFAPLSDPRHYDEYSHSGTAEFSHPSYMRSEDGHGLPTRDHYQTPPRRGGDLRHYSSAVFDSPRGPPSEPVVHRSTVPVIRPQALVPDPSTPRHSIPRKSITPGGSPGDTESLAGGAFSPDSFDILNPNLRAAKSINDPVPKYDTPESIREAARDRFKEEELANGPIFDAAGNVIDPSDHLPRDAWAPEPEKKTPRKTHEVKLKFRHHAQSSSQPAQARVTPLREQSSAQSARFSSPYGGSHTSYGSPSVHGGTPRREPPLRPHSMQTMPHHSSPSMPSQQQPIHAYSAEDVSPSHTSGGRNRLQKRAPPQHQHSGPASSPGMAQIHTPPSARGGYHPDTAPNSMSGYGRQYREEYHQQQHQPTPPSGGMNGYRHGDSNYSSPTPLREMRNPNAGYSSSSPYGPAYGQRPGSMAAAPPVPAKIPLGREQEDWESIQQERYGDGVDRLSMEIGSIDLGPRVGGRMRRR